VIVMNEVYDTTTTEILENTRTKPGTKCSLPICLVSVQGNKKGMPVVMTN